GPPLQPASARSLPPPRLHQPGGQRGNLRAGRDRLSVGGRCDGRTCRRHEGPNLMNEPKRKTLRARLTGWLKGETTPGVDPDVVPDMAKLLEETGLSEIEVERGSVRVRVAKNGGHGAHHAPMPMPMPAPAPLPAPVQAPPPPKVEEPKAEA